MSEVNRRAGLVALAFLFTAGCGDESGGAEAAGDAGAADRGVPTSGDGGAEEGPLPLTTTLCDDPSLVAELGSLGGGDASFGELNAETAQQMLAAPTEGPFYMVNLIKYRERAVYPDGRDTDLTGREANALYSPTDFLAAIGARVVFNAAVDDQIDGDEPVWEDVAIVEYPCPLAFFAMSADPAFQARSIHKDAGVETTIVLFTQLEPSSAVDDPDQSTSSHPPSAEDPAFDLIHLMRFHDVAQYEEGTDEPERSGQEAWELYQSSGTPGSADIGIYTTGTFVVQGTLIGDGRAWDEVVLVRMPSRAGFQALLDDEGRVAGRYHRLAALADNYSMITTPLLSDIPRDGGGGSTMLPVTADGTGTVCSSDADCPGGGVDSCLSDGRGPGFCTREGCGAGECQSPYLCCRACAAVVADMLPFDGSACLPETLAPSLTQAPASCTCD